MITIKGLHQLKKNGTKSSVLSILSDQASDLCDDIVS